MRRAGRLSAGRAREGRHLDLKPATDLAPLREVAALAKAPGFTLPPSDRQAGHGLRLARVPSGAPSSEAKTPPSATR